MNIQTSWMPGMRAKTTAIGTLVAIILSLTPQSQAAPLYTYEPVWEGWNNQYQGTEERYCPGAAINNRGDVVFRTGETISTFERIRLYVAWGGQQPAELIFDTMTNNDDPEPSAVQCTVRGLLGINDLGVVAVPLNWVNVDSDGNIIAFNDVGYGLVQPGVGLIRTLRGHDQTSGRVNDALQMAFTTQDGFALTVKDGVTTSVSVMPDNTRIFGLANINGDGAAGAVGVVGYPDPADFNTTVFRATPPGEVEGVGIGRYLGPDYLGSLGYTDFFTPGMNDRGWLSLSTNFNNNVANPNPRVVLVGPTGAVFPVVEAAGSQFANFSQTRGQSSLGTSLNNFNRVSFVAQIEGETGTSGDVYVGDPSGDLPRLAIGREIRFTDGRLFDTGGFANDVQDHGVNSLNDSGEIVVSALGSLYDADGAFAGQTQILFLARPAPGVEPGNPILPDPGDELPGGGWRLFCPSGIWTSGRCFVDPPIATGYDFEMEASSTGAFTSVLVPVPLPGGDADFTVEFNGTTAPLAAGTAYYFASGSPDPVRKFRISGIDPAEGLDPTDPTAFVSGLTFSGDVTEDLSLTMVPVVGDAPDDDADYEFVGFYPPIANAPGVNQVKAGRIVPIKWSLISGNGVYISDLATLKSLTNRQISCESGAALGPVEPAGASGDPALTYDPETGQFQFNWKTERNWRRNCRELTLELSDGQVNHANFRFN